MKAYEVYYSVPGESTSTILLVGQGEDLETVLAEKDRHFEAGTHWSSIESKKEIPLSNVLIKDLSVSEFMKLIGKEI